MMNFKEFQLLFACFCKFLISLNSYMGFRTHVSGTHDPFMELRPNFWLVDCRVKVALLQGGMHRQASIGQYGQWNPNMD